MSDNVFFKWRIRRGLSYPKLYEKYGIDKTTWQKLETGRGIKPSSLDFISNSTGISRDILDHYAEPPFTDGEIKWLKFCRVVPLMDAADIAGGCCPGWNKFCDALADTEINGHTKPIRKKGIQKTKLMVKCLNSQCPINGECLRYMAKHKRFDMFREWTIIDGVCEGFKRIKDGDDIDKTREIGVQIKPKVTKQGEYELF